MSAKAATVTSRGVTFLRPTLDEKHEQANIENLVTQLGGQVYTLGTRRAQFCGHCGSRTTDQGTRQTPGIADLVVFLPPAPRAKLPGSSWVALWVECKGKGGTLTIEQVRFRSFCRAANVAHVVGGLDAFTAWLRIGGWVRA